MEINFHFSTTKIKHLSHQISTFINERKSVNIPKQTHFQNGDQMNISWNVKFCNKKTLFIIHPTQSHSIPPNPTIDVLILKLVGFIFGTETMMRQKKLPGVDGRGLGWPRWDPSHSNPTPIPPGPIVQNCHYFS